MKWKILLGHILFWCVIIMAYAISAWGYRDGFKEAILYELIFLPIRVIAVYLNWFIGIPKLLYKDKIISYFLSIMLLLLILAYIQRVAVVEWFFPIYFSDWTISEHPYEFFRIMQYVVVIATPLAFSTGIKLFIDWNNQRNKSRQLEIEKREAELKYLKSQINPHFLFNTLNNLYGLSIEQSSKVPELLIKLSDFLSYSLYESNSEKTTVARELKLIRDFIDLETNRYENRVQVQWNLDETLNEKEIASLLFMPLVENAIKHGVKEETEKAIIIIDLTYQDPELVFRIKNTLPTTKDEESNTGIGLANLRRRLELLYPDQYSLTKHRDTNHFTAVLKLKLYG